MKLSLARLPALLAVVAMGLLSTGCYTTRLQDTSMTAGAKHDEWRSFFFWGLAGHAKVDVREYCEGGEVAEVSTGTNAGTAIVTGLTLGIYSPEKIYVTCANGKSVAFDAARGVAR
jgi:Bor protein